MEMNIRHNYSQSRSRVCLPADLRPCDDPSPSSVDSACVSFSVSSSSDQTMLPREEEYVEQDDEVNEDSSAEVGVEGTHTVIGEPSAQACGVGPCRSLPSTSTNAK